MAKTLIGYPGIQADELKIISLTLEKLLRNLPRLGGYTQRVCPGAHPVLAFCTSKTRWVIIMSTERLRSSTTKFDSILWRSGA